MNATRKLRVAERDMFFALELGRYGEFRRLSRECARLREIRSRELDLERIDRAASIDAPCPEDWDNQTPEEREAIARTIDDGNGRIFA